MKKKREIFSPLGDEMRLRIRKMKLTLLMTLLVMASFGNGFSQVTISLHFNKANIHDVLGSIEQKTDYIFLYKDDVLKSSKEITIDFKEARFEEVLKAICEQNNIDFEVRDRQIILKEKSDIKIISVEVQPQRKELSGSVKDNKGLSIPGVSVVVKGSTIGTITNFDGQYRLSVPVDAEILAFSFVGMKTQEITIGRKSSFDVVLEEDMVGVNEVVVVGYGTQKKVNLTGAITSLDGKALAHRQVSQSSMVLQGIAPGVVVTQRNGQPGRDGGTISIRGKTTMGIGDNNPLILVDGVEMGINNIDPSMIESISILKDAASSSIYGSRAANGVILVTTKRADSQKMTVSYNSYMGFQRPTDLPNMVGAIDHMLLTNEAYVNTGKSPLYSDAYIQEYRTNMASNPDKYPDTDWYDQVLTSDGFTQNHFLTMMGGTEKAKIAVSMGYLDQDGIMANTGYTRSTIRFNTDLQLSNTFSTQIDAHIMQSKITEPSRGTSDAIHWSGRIPANQVDFV